MYYIYAFLLVILFNHSHVSPISS